MRYWFYLLLIVMLFPAQGLQAQFLNSYLMFANHTNLELNAEGRVTGAANMVHFNQDRILPWQNPTDHEVGIYVTVVLLDILFDIYIDHDRHQWMAKCDRFAFLGDKDHQVEIDISHEGVLLFTILYDFEDLPLNIYNPTNYNLRYPDGSLDRETPWSLTYEQYNSPHEAGREIIIEGVPYKFIYGALREDLDPTGDIMFSLSEADPVSFHLDPDESDLLDPTVLNMVSYNPGILMPLNANDQEEKERSAVFHKAMPKNMDIIVLQELFQPYYSRQILDSLKADYPYQTDILNNDDLIPGLELSGGVAIISKFPILEEDDFSYQLEGTSVPSPLDAQADKGVKYAKIDKLGQVVHVFGTHTYGAWSDLTDMSHFIHSKLDPNKDEIVIMGGDMNTGAYGNQYEHMRDTLNFVEPTYKTLTHTPANLRGTTWGVNHFQQERYWANMIDYLYANSNFKVPTVSYNDVQAYRLNSTDRKFWGIFDLGDHQPVYARFEFPSMDVLYADEQVCVGDPLELSMSCSISEPVVMWFKDGDLLANETDLLLSIDEVAISDWGDYRCEVLYPYLPDVVVNGSHYPGYNAPEPITGRLVKEFTVAPDPENCAILTNSVAQITEGVTFYPNPVIDEFHLKNDSGREFEVSIYGAGGKLMHRSWTNERLGINAREWTPGMYTLILTDQDKGSVNWNFVKQ